MKISLTELKQILATDALVVTLKQENADLLVKVAELEQGQQSDSAAAAALSVEAKDTAAKLAAAIPST